MRILLSIVASLGLTSCVCFCDADGLVRDIAADGAVDCGRATNDAERAVVLACVEDAIANARPFYGAWRRIGRDTEVRTYVVEDPEGQTWVFGYDGGLSGSCPTLAGGRCATPLERRTDARGDEFLGCDSLTTSSEAVLCER